MRKRSSCHEKPEFPLGGCRYMTRYQKQRKKGEDGSELFNPSSESPPALLKQPPNEEGYLDDDDLPLKEIKEGSSSAGERQTQQPAGEKSTNPPAFQPPSKVPELDLDDDLPLKEREGSSEKTKNESQTEEVQQEKKNTANFVRPNSLLGGRHLRNMTPDDWKSYYAQLEKHEGYEPIIYPPDVLIMGLLTAIHEDELRSIGLRSACRKALKRYNNKEKTQWQYVDLIKANTIRYFEYYVTFEAKRGDDRKQFQTLLASNMGGPYVVKEVRPKPLPMAD